MLCTGAGNTVELGASQFRLTVFHGDDFLHRALAESLTAKHETALVVLDRAGKNF